MKNSEYLKSISNIIDKVEDYLEQELRKEFPFDSRADIEDMSTEIAHYLYFREFREE